jgi:predicted component of type VI protein secretion system
MTDQELAVLARWQESPPAKVCDAVRNLEKAITELRELMTYREGVTEMRQQFKSLVEQREELNELIWAARPLQQAAE